MRPRVINYQHSYPTDSQGAISRARRGPSVLARACILGLGKKVMLKPVGVNIPADPLRQASWCL